MLNFKSEKKSQIPNITLNMAPKQRKVCLYRKKEIVKCVSNKYSFIIQCLVVATKSTTISQSSKMWEKNIFLRLAWHWAKQFLAVEKHKQTLPVLQMTLFYGQVPCPDRTSCIFSAFLILIALAFSRLPVYT